MFNFKYCSSITISNYFRDEIFVFSKKEINNFKINYEGKLNENSQEQYVQDNKKMIILLK